ncbi:MAG TPA: hypothetical protein VJ476_01050 [Rhizomicrobium sp.]|nr:hypothetical protein [Rhizomicrobium sp.]
MKAILTAATLALAIGVASAQTTMPNSNQTPEPLGSSMPNANQTPEGSSTVPNADGTIAPNSGTTAPNGTMRALPPPVPQPMPCAPGTPNCTNPACPPGPQPQTTTPPNCPATP